MRVSIIIPNYNGMEYLRELLPSIADQTFGDYEVVVIDDCSPDRSAVEYMRTFVKDRANFRLVENTENLGFVRSCNKGFRMTCGGYVCILTNDTRVESGFIKRNVEVMDSDSSIGVLSCTIIDQDGNNWFCGGLYSNGVRTNLQDDFHGVRLVDWVAGTACFYRRELLNKVGLLDGTFVMYHEDVDFCLRARSQTDYKVRVFSDKLVTHYLRHHEPLRQRLPKLARVQYYGHKNSVLLARRYCPRYLPRVLLSNMGDIIRWPINAMSQRKVRSLLVSCWVAMIITLATLAGMLKDAKFKKV